MVSGPGANDREEPVRALSTSAATSAAQSLKGRRMEDLGVTGDPGKTWSRRALFRSSRVEAPRSSGKWGGGGQYPTSWPSIPFVGSLSPGKSSNGPSSPF